MRLVKPLSLGLLSRTTLLRRRRLLAIGVLGAFRLDDPSRLILEAAFWKAAAPLLDGAVLDQAMPKPQAEVLLLGTAHAPHGTPVQALDAGFRVGPLARRLRVFGDRHWTDRGGLIATPPQPFLAMPVTAARAFGGPGFAENQAGRGHDPAALLRAGLPAPLPNIEDPDRPLLRPEDAPPPLLTGPVDLAAPSRRRLAGTYDAAWLRNDHPGLPPDADLRIFQAAQPAQWHQGFFTGEEEIVLAGFRPDPAPSRSRLPGMRMRAFLRQRVPDAPPAVHEVALRLDTVWLLPDAGLGCTLHRGLHPVEDPDGLDAEALLLAYERLSDPPRPQAHYVEQMALRTDPETAIRHVFREGPLRPEPTEADRARKAAARERARAARAAERERRAAIEQRETERLTGVPMAWLPPPPPPDLPEIPIPTEEEIADLDIDLGEILDAVDRLVAAVEERAAEAPDPDAAHLDAAMRGLPTPEGTPSPEAAQAIAAAARARDPEALLADLPPELDPETRDRAEAAIRTALAPPAPPDPEAAWTALADRIRGVVPADPALALLDGLDLSGLAARDDPLSLLPPAEGPEDAAARAAWQARRAATPPPAPPDLDALLAGIETGETPAGRTPPAAQIEAARAAFREKIAAALPGLAHLPPGEAMATFLARAAPPEPPPGRAEVEAAIADLRAKLEAPAEADPMAEIRRLSPEPVAEHLAWQDGFAPRLRALIEELRAAPAGLAGRDFADVRLPGLALPGADLRDSFWERADLAGAALPGARLDQAVFTAAVLEGADLSEAALPRANLARARLGQARLPRADLTTSGWFETEAPGADLSGATLADVRMFNSRLPGAALRGAVLRDAMLLQSDLAGADFSGARLERCIVLRCDLTAARFAGAELDTCAFMECPMEGADFAGAGLANVAILLGRLAGARFRRVRSTNLTLHGADLTGADFAGALLPAATLSETKLAGASFRRAVLRRAVLSMAAAEGADFTAADLHEAQLRRAALGGATLLGANLYQADLDGAALAFADLTGANLRWTTLARPTDDA